MASSDTFKPGVAEQLNEVILSALSAYQWDLVRKGWDDRTWNVCVIKSKSEPDIELVWSTARPFQGGGTAGLVLVQLYVILRRYRAQDGYEPDQPGYQNIVCYKRDDLAEVLAAALEDAGYPVDPEAGFLTYRATFETNHRTDIPRRLYDARVCFRIPEADRSKYLEPAEPQVVSP